MISRRRFIRFRRLKFQCQLTDIHKPVPICRISVQTRLAGRLSELHPAIVHAGKCLDGPIGTQHLIPVHRIVRRLDNDGRILAAAQRECEQAGLIMRVQHQVGLVGDSCNDALGTRLLLGARLLLSSGHLRHNLVHTIYSDPIFLILIALH